MTLALTITPFYFAASIVILLFLTTVVIKHRVKNQVSLMDGGISALTKAIRAHANFVETVPFILIAMVMCELNGTSALMLHLIGGSMIIGRIAHAKALMKTNFTLRRIGMSLTLLSMILSAAMAVASVLMA